MFILFCDVFKNIGKHSVFLTTLLLLFYWLIIINITIVYTIDKSLVNNILSFIYYIYFMLYNITGIAAVSNCHKSICAFLEKG